MPPLVMAGPTRVFCKMVPTSDTEMGTRRLEKPSKQSLHAFHAILDCSM